MTHLTRVQGARLKGTIRNGTLAMYHVDGRMRLVDVFWRVFSGPRD